MRRRAANWPAHAPRCASSEAAPPTWSLSRWLSSSRSMRPSPRARSSGSSTRCAASASSEYFGPASYSSRCSRVRTSTAVPWPMSATTTSKSPAAGRSTGGASKGSSKRHTEQAQPPGQRQDQQRAAEQAAGHAPSGCGRSRPQAEGPLAQPGQHLHQCLHQRAGQRPQRAEHDAKQPSGTMASVTSGMASRFATKPTSDTCWKKTMLNGARPMLATTWVRKPARSAATSRARAAPRFGAGPRPAPSPSTDPPQRTTARSRAASAPRVEQRHHHRRGQQHQRCGQRTPAAQHATVASIHSVRCAGTPQPASSA